MRIELSNIAAVRHADIEIDGITVVAGENDTGKSTVSKALWCMFDSFYKYEDQFVSYRRNAIEDACRILAPSVPGARASRTFFVHGCYRALTRMLDLERPDPTDVRNISPEEIKRLVSEEVRSAENARPEDFEPLLREVERILSYDDAELMCGVVENNFDSEFSHQPCNVDDPSTRAGVTLVVGGVPLSAVIMDNKVKEVQSLLRLEVPAIYVDDAFILDEVAEGRMYRLRMADALFAENRHQRLTRLLRRSRRADGNVLSERMASDRLVGVIDQIERIVPGAMLRREGGELVYTPEGYTEPINAANMSAGMKTFSMLKLLLQNGSIEQKSVVILDEPEVHLHPEWQIALAELIVLLQRSFDLHVLLTTHSPYFLRAIQVKSAKHSIATRCRYYQAERMGKWCEIRDVTDSTERVFEQLVRPLEILEAEEAEL